MVDKVFLIDWFNYECHYGTKKALIRKFISKVDGKPKYWTEKDLYGGGVWVYQLVQNLEAKPKIPKSYKNRFTECDWSEDQPGYDEDSHEVYWNEKAFTTTRSFKDSGEEEDYNHFQEVDNNFIAESVSNELMTDEEATNLIFKKVIKETRNIELCETVSDLFQSYNQHFYCRLNQTYTIPHGELENLANLLLAIRKEVGWVK